jgi:hypothetical protein
MLTYSLTASLQMALLFFAAPAHAARPFFTDDARVVDKGHCQLESFYKEQRAYSGSEFWFIPACNPAFAPLESGLEVTVGRNRIEDERNTIVQAKMLFKELQTNGTGIAGSIGSFGGDAYLNGIASFSLLDDRAVVHTNLGTISRTGPTWGFGLEALLAAPRVYGIAEVFGQRSQTPTLHYGLRFWVLPNRFQIDATRGQQSADPAQRFLSLGIRLLF